MLTIFANIRINEEEGLQHLKDSFYSFNTTSDNWLINVRGTLRAEAIDFLAKELTDKAIFFELIDDSRGWIENAIEMLTHAKNDYLLVWNEDHINIAPQEELLSVVKEMKERGADYLLYSWWLFGAARKEFDMLSLEKGKHIDTIYLTKKRWGDIRANGYPYYLLSLCGIYRKDFFKQMLLKDQVKMPMLFTKNLYRGMTLLNHFGIHFSQRKYFHFFNKIFFHKLRRFPKETPFDLEKAPDRTDMLPFTVALAKQELFACIDDDLDTPGYQLIKRGKYPLSFSLQAGKIDSRDCEILESNEKYKVSKIFLSKNEEYWSSYYEDTMRIQHLSKETIIVISGKVAIETIGESSIFSANETISVYPNIGYIVASIEDSSFIIVSPNFKNKTIHYLGKQGLQKKK